MTGESAGKTSLMLWGIYAYTLSVKIITERDGVCVMKGWGGVIKGWGGVIKKWGVGGLIKELAIAAKEAG